MSIWYPIKMVVRVRRVDNPWRRAQPIVLFVFWRFVLCFPIFIAPSSSRRTHKNKKETCVFQVEITPRRSYNEANVKHTRKLITQYLQAISVPQSVGNIREFAGFVRRVLQWHWLLLLLLLVSANIRFTHFVGFIFTRIHQNIDHTGVIPNFTIAINEIP